MILFRNVTKIYKNGTKALDNINIRINDGEFVFITGQSGAGKSTMIHLLTCEDAPTEGKLIVDGTDLKSLSRRQIPKYRRKIGVVFQDFRLIPTMTVYDNIAFAMRVVGRGRSEIKRRVASALELVGLTHKASVYPEQLSGGEQQRIALARAIINSPSLIIADEPTGNVDPQMSLEIMKLLSTINKNGISVLVVTHEHALVEAFSKREIRLDNGTVLYDTAKTHKDAVTEEAETDTENEKRKVVAAK